ncbi:MAG: hypothetical protein ABSH20_27315 [Tepidisphaeraceae bacterium]|jgi:hypothetical protein
MKRVSYLVTGLVLFVAGAIASAAPVVSVGTVAGPLNGTVSFQLMVSDTGDAATEDIEGMTLTLQVGDGTNTTPWIEAVDMLSGTIWTGHASLSTLYRLDDASHPQFASWGIYTNDPGDYVNANGVLATVVIDTTGATPGDYSLNVIRVMGSGSDTDFQNGLGESVGSTLTNGVLTVPEPTMASGLCALVLCCLRRRDRAHRPVHG